MVRSRVVQLIPVFGGLCLRSVLLGEGFQSFLLLLVVGWGMVSGVLRELIRFSMFRFEGRSRRAVTTGSIRFLWFFWCST